MELQLMDGSSVHLKLVATGFSLLRVVEDDGYQPLPHDTLIDTWVRMLQKRGDVLLRPTWLLNVMYPATVFITRADAIGCTDTDMCQRCPVILSVLDELDARYDLDLAPTYRRLAWLNDHRNGSFKNRSSNNVLMNSA